MQRIIGLVAGLVLGLVLGATASPAEAATPRTVAPAAVTFTPAALAVTPARLRVQTSFETRVLQLTNRHRSAKGCAPLRARYSLRRSARTHTKTMARHNEMSHQLPGEPRFSIRITRAGYRSWRLVAENVARGFDSPEEVVKAWLASPGHRRNMLNCRLRDLGVGVVVSNGQLWWTQNFGRR
ncbi:MULTISPECIES: CAP domain-containing protein [Nocardioides]|uniref:CAP domain-containing protein n=1 Tax=Nocardioides vastitatis TaxID=2568655 RepID=A0ABW0ZPH6_9ACTN|nr:CAP domain-containing protein [Nocardioides sp.]THJ06708.1 CAP domain-containing protein [Nocardioides sp.]